MNGLYRRGHELKRDTRKEPRDSIDDGRYEGSGQQWAASYSNVAGRRIMEKLNVLQGVAKVVKNRRTPIEKRAAVFGRRDTARAAIKQRHADDALKIANRSGDGGLV